MTTNPTRSAVEATVTGLRAGEVCGACGQPWTGEKCGQADNGWDRPVCYSHGVVFPDDAADMLLALFARAESAEAERDAARVGEKFWREHCDEVCENSRDGNAALTEIDECWLATGMMTNRALLSLSEQISALQCEHESELAAARETIAAVTKQREDADHDADLARSQLGSVAMDNADLRATIARLTAEVQAARKTTTFIETADGVYAVSIGTPKFCLLAKDYASAKERANEAREFAARARTNPKEPTT